MSDDDILGSIMQGSPDEAPDLQKLQKQGLPSSAILDGYVQYHAQNQPQQSWLDTAGNFIKAPLYGASQELDRAASTERNVLGATDVANAEQGASAGLKSLIVPRDKQDENSASIKVRIAVGL
jgi:hypothetical protein